MFNFILIAATLIVGVYFVYKYARTAWNKVELEDKLKKADLVHNQYNQIKEIDTKRLEKEQKEVDKFLDKR